jgi:anaerobic ribonucleoside-triphosphate reductase activating protein
MPGPPTTLLPQRHRDSGESVIRLARTEPLTTVLGPGGRRVVWTQGCSLRCAGCLVPESHELNAGSIVTPEELAASILDGPCVAGVTFSGGEPSRHSVGLTQVIQQLRLRRPEWTFMAYTGFRLEVLQSRGTPNQRAFLDELDILVDGPFVASLARSERWRGSINQRVHGLTAAGRAAIAQTVDKGSEFEITVERGTFRTHGVSPNGFRDATDDALRRHGIVPVRRPVDSPDNHAPQGAQA